MCGRLVGLQLLGEHLVVQRHYTLNWVPPSFFETRHRRTA